MKKWMTALALLLTLSGCSVLGPASLDASRDIRAGVCRWKFTGETDFESKAPGAGKGSSYDCLLGHATIYRYTLGRQDWAVGTPAFDEALKAAAAEALGNYRSKGVTVAAHAIGAGDTGIAEIKGRKFKGYRFDVSQGNSAGIASYLLMTVENGELLKYRVTFTLPQSKGQAQVLLMLVKASLPDLPAPVTAPATAPTPPPATPAPVAAAQP